MSSTRSLRFGAAISLVLLAASPAIAQTPQIQFTAAVPPAPKQAQIYRLAPTPAPVAFLNEKLSIARLPAVNLEARTFIARLPTAAPARAAVVAPVATDQDRVRAFIDSDSGDTHLIPNLSELAHPAGPVAAIPLERAQTIARAALTDVRFIPRDVTEVRFATAIPVTAAAVPHAGAAAGPLVERADPALVMTMQPAVRYASGLPVYGRGSRAVVTVGNDGNVVGALRRWRTASLGDRIAPSITGEQVRADIQRQLAPQVASAGSKAVVDKIELAYYDGNASFLQPVYHFEATITSGDPRVSPIRTEGFVALGKTLEPIPDLAAPATDRPATPKQAINARGDVLAQNASSPAVDGDFTLGEYVNQNWPNDGGYVDMADTFLSGLTSLSGHPPITRTQWYVAYPWEVVGPSSKSFMNAVNVAYTVPHGNWLYNTTLSNNADGWSVPNIGTGGNPGFGHAAGGVLATWIIMSCEVIPSYYDRQHQASGPANGALAFDAWWPVFQGLHNVIGFRTIMYYPDDSLQYGFGRDASIGGDLNAAWFQEVAANDGNRGTYANGNLKGSPTSRYDSASTMIDARDLGQSIYSVGPQSASTTLWNFWMGD